MDEIIKNVGNYAGTVITLITLITLIVKPLRTKFVEWISRMSNVQGLTEKLDSLTEKIDRSITQNEKMQEELNKQSNALQATLRNSILRTYYRSLEDGYISTYNLENVEMLNAEYVRLNGNSFIHTTMEKIRQLPIKND